MVEPESHSMEMVEFSSCGTKQNQWDGDGISRGEQWCRVQCFSNISIKYLVFRVLKVDNDILILPIHGGIKFGIHSIPPICCMLKVMKKDYRKLVLRPLRWLS